MGACGGVYAAILGRNKTVKGFMLSSDICKDICCVHAHAHRR